MRFIATCADVDINTWESLMMNARPCSYKKLCQLIKKEYPDMFQNLALNLRNPWADKTQQTKTHYILVHSATEYFFEKD